MANLVGWLQYLLVAAILGAALVGLAVLVVLLRVRSRHGSLRKGVEATFRRPPRPPRTPGRKHYYIPYWESR